MSNARELAELGLEVDVDANGNVVVANDIISIGNADEKSIGFNFYGQSKYNFHMDGNTDADKMFIRKGTTNIATFDTSGNLGLGTDGPACTFHAATPSANGAYRFETTHPSGIPNLQLKGASSATIRYMDENDAIQARIDLRDGGKFQFIDGTGNQHMVIDSNGKVGINNPTPARTLDITGDIHISDGNIYGPATGIFGFLNGNSAAKLHTGGVYAGSSYANNTIGSTSGIIEAENGFKVDGETIIDSEGRHAGHQGQPVLGDGGYGSIRYRVTRGAYYNNHSYIHIKTSLRHTANGTHGAVSEMYRVNIHGYAYSHGQPIDAICCGYVYGGANYLGSQSVVYPSGSRPVSQYMSSDGYLTFTIHATTYYCTFALDWERAGGNGQLRDGDSILSVTTSNSATI